MDHSIFKELFVQGELNLKIFDNYKSSKKISTYNIIVRIFEF